MKKTLIMPNNVNVINNIKREKEIVEMTKKNIIFLKKMT